MSRPKVYGGTSYNVEIEKSKNNGAEINEHELVKRKVFTAAISMMMSAECVNN
jgi:hypothetical protein